MSILPHDNQQIPQMVDSPLTFTSEQGAQFELAVFTELAKLMGANQICSIPIHPQSYGMIESFHRTLKAILMCKPDVPWPVLMPTVFPCLRTVFKDYLQTSSVEMHFDSTLSGHLTTPQDRLRDKISVMRQKLRPLGESLKEEGILSLEKQLERN